MGFLAETDRDDIMHRQHHPSTRCYICGKPMAARCDATKKDGKPCNLPMCEEHRNRVADDLDVDVCGFHNRPGHIAQAIENRAKREEAREYFIDKYSRANFRVVPGHWPDFSTKEEVDEWFVDLEAFSSFINMKR